jgi:hypothetical protein
MSVMIEIYYPKPVNTQREGSISAHVARHGGRVTFREEDSQDTICLTAEFDSWEAARTASNSLQAAGEHFEGPAEYGV